MMGLSSFPLTNNLNADRFSPQKGGICMKGGYYQPKGRDIFRVWFPWQGKKIFINKYLDGTPIYHEEQAKRVLEKIRGEVDQGTFDPALWGKDKALIFQKAWSIYQEQSPCKLDRSQARERIYNDFLLPYFGGKSLKEIEEHHVMEWWSTIPKTYAPSYLKVIRATLKALFNFHRVTRIKMIEFPAVKVQKKTPLWLSRIDQDRIIEFIPTQHQPIIRFIRAYGCRPSEACSLKKSDIDFNKGIVTFGDRKNDKDNALALFDEIRSILRSGKLTHVEFAFCTANGQQYSRQILYHVWIEASRKAHRKYAIKIVSLKNGTRHSLACQLLEMGESTSTVARILGNTSGVVERSYGNISIERTRQVLETISAVGRMK